MIAFTVSNGKYHNAVVLIVKPRRGKARSSESLVNDEKFVVDTVAMNRYGIHSVATLLLHIAVASVSVSDSICFTQNSIRNSFVASNFIVDKALIWTGLQAWILPDTYLTLRAPAIDFNEFQYSHTRPQSCFSNLPFWQGKTLVYAYMFMVKHRLFIEHNIFRPEVAPLCLCVVGIRSRSNPRL